MAKSVRLSIDLTNNFDLSLLIGLSVSGKLSLGISNYFKLLWRILLLCNLETTHAVVFLSLNGLKTCHRKMLNKKRNMFLQGNNASIKLA